MSSADQHAALLKRGFTALQAGDIGTAEKCCHAVLSANRNVPQAHFLVGLIALEMKNRKIAANAFHTVTKLDPKNTGAWAQLAKLFSQMGYTLRADEALRRAEEIGTSIPMVQNLMGAVNTTLGEYGKAQSWYHKAYLGEPNNPAFGVNLANAQSFNGDVTGAEETITGVLARHRDNPQGHWILAGLRKAVDDMHAKEMEALAEKHAADPHAAAFLNYGAGKEYEDLSLWDRAFPAFLKGAQARRKTISYDEREEERLFKTLVETCTPRWFDSARSSVESSAPIFIIGQPRTGTTLIERIVTSHSDVVSAGELQQFYLSMRRQAKADTPARMSADLAVSAAAVDPDVLGKAYIASTVKQAGGAPHFVDKMPVNYLYAPYIARALPNAKIIHLVRDPMDSCFSSFKQLFADAYPHSYDLGEMARHHVRYLELMKNWRDLLGERMLDVFYEDTVQDLEANARRIIKFLGLPWQDECLQFHEQKTSVSTASAVQVREPAHTRSVGRWRRYETSLQPVAEILRAAGVDI